MDSLGGLLWSLRAPDAVRAELVRRYPSKLPTSIEVAVPDVVAAIECAWRCYQPRMTWWGNGGEPPEELPGAAAAIFDVTRSLSLIGLPLPDDVRAELEHLAGLALAGGGVGRGQGAASPIDAHRKALRKRWRHSWVAWILQNGHLNAREEEEFKSWRYAGRIDLKAWEADLAARPEMSSAVTRACELAREYSGDKSAQWRAFYDDYRDINEASRNTELWPGIFYIPSEETCDVLGWDFVNQMAREFTSRNSPLFIVA